MHPSDGLRPGWAVLVGSLAVLVLAVTVGQVGQSTHRPALALTLVVPVIGAALLGGRRPAQVVAALATLSFSLVLPPVGSPKVRVADDLVALVVFSAVAFAIGTLVARRVDALERVDGQRRALLRSVSHDLRTPLSAIRAAASELESGEHDEATRAELLGLVSSEAERLDRLVGNLLGMARVEAGPSALRLGVVDLGELVDAATDRLARLFGSSPLLVDVASDLPTVRGDHALLDQLVTNLLENAVRHDRGEGIAVSVDEHAGRLRLRVADHGPGVPPGQELAIFEAFRSGPNPGSDGLGLAMCKAVVEAHGGTIAVEPTPGSGATFVVALPVSPPR
jgi:K+-sensing histidine kinase KdpD